MDTKSGRIYRGTKEVQEALDRGEELEDLTPTHDPIRDHIIEQTCLNETREFINKGRRIKLRPTRWR